MLTRFALLFTAALFLMMPDDSGRATCEAIHSTATCTHILRG